MSIENQLKIRSGNICEICNGTDNLTIYEVPPNPEKTENFSVYTCDVCKPQIEKKAILDETNFKCLTTTMWSEIPAVQVVIWRLLNRFKSATWAQEALDMIYLDDTTLLWAKQSGDHENNEEELEMHRDSFGAILQNGDNVVLTKSLDVKGSTLNAKLGTVVRNIKLVNDNYDQIEGKVEGQTIVILTKYLRKN